MLLLQLIDCPIIISDESKNTYSNLSISSGTYAYEEFVWSIYGLYDLSMLFSSPSDAVDELASFFLTLILRFPSLSESLSLSDFLSINYVENLRIDNVL